MGVYSCHTYRLYSRMSIMTKAEYARHRGVTPAAVSKLIDRDRIFVLPDGTVDQEISDILLEETSPKYGSKPKRKPSDVELDKLTEKAREEVVKKLSHTGSYAAARTELTQYKAQMAQLELERVKAESVKSSDVYQEAFECSRQLRDAIFGITDRLAAVLAAETSEREVRRILDAEYRKILTNICDKLIQKYNLPGSAH